MTDRIMGFTLLELFTLGGITMWPLLFFSIATIAIILERLIYLGYYNLRLDDLKIKVKDFIHEGKFREAVDYLQGLTKRRIGARILLALVIRAEKKNNSEHHLEKTAEAEAMTCINSLETGFNFLVALGSISPLTGFLGTVTGMIGAFRSISEAEDVSAQIVANGIYEALITTVFGLIIAIMAMVAHSLLTNKVDKFTSEVEKTCSELIIDIMENANEN